MKVCLACRHSFAHEDWRCPACGHAPQIIDGFPSFAPELAISNDGMAANAHHALDAQQEHSFWFRGRNRLLVDIVRRYCSSTTALLEVGCGTGFVLAALMRALPTARGSGSEIYVNGLPYANRRLDGRVSLLQMDARAIPFSMEFDLIAACDVLEHVVEDEMVLQEMYRALKPGGRILLTVPQHPFLWSQSDTLAHHKRRYRTRELSDKVRRAGFRIVRNTSFVSLLMPILVLQRLTRGRQKNYDANAEFSIPSWLDRILEAAMDCDRLLIKLGISLPAGGSRLILAQRDS